MRFVSQIKKVVLFVSAGIMASFVVVNNAYAQSAEVYLQIIAKNTAEILGRVDKIPSHIQSMFEYTSNWLKPDDSDDTAQLQSNFALLGTNFVNLPTAQNSIQQRLAADIVQQPIASFTQPQNAPAILGILPNINNMMYSSMLGLPPVTKGAQFDPYAYVKSAGGAEIPHTLPPRPEDKRWSGGDENINRYRAYYNTVIAAESFSSYALSNLYSENQSGNQSTALQNKLVEQASSSAWLLSVTTEELGKVLRQILIFQSQTYVLLTQLVQTQKQLLTATVMTNSLLIANNQLNEMVLVSRASGVPLRQ